MWCRRKARGNKNRLDIANGIVNIPPIKFITRQEFPVKEHNETWNRNKKKKKEEKRRLVKDKAISFITWKSEVGKIRRRKRGRKKKPSGHCFEKCFDCHFSLIPTYKSQACVGTVMKTGTIFFFFSFFFPPLFPFSFSIFPSISPLKKVFHTMIFKKVEEVSWTNAKKIFESFISLSPCHSVFQIYTFVHFSVENCESIFFFFDFLSGGNGYILLFLFRFSEFFDDIPFLLWISPLFYVLFL